jgi:hypothetical protein
MPEPMPRYFRSIHPAAGRKRRGNRKGGFDRMSITIPKTQSTSMQTMANLEREFGHLPVGFLLFLIQHDGAKPGKNVFNVPDGRNAGVDHFIPASEIIRVRDTTAGFPRKMLPFARSTIGNLVYLNMVNNAVYLWDHEVYSADVKLADSFDEFLATLEDADPECEYSSE